MRRILIVPVIAISGLVPSAQPTTVEPEPGPVFELVNATPEQTDIVNAAIRRFVDEGLELPSLTITFADSRAGCDGHMGMFVPASPGESDAVDQILICHPWTFFWYHELAHAWEHHTATDQTRYEVLEYWDLAVWNDHDHAWDERGIEKAASTVAWTLTFDEAPEGLDIRRHVCGYELLTGNPLPDNITIDCTEDPGRRQPTPSTLPTNHADRTDEVPKNPADDPRTGM